MSAPTLRRRLFPLHEPGGVDAFLARFPCCVIFKAGTSDKTFEAWSVVETLLEPRVDVAVGLMRLPEDRAASDHVAMRTGVVHRSPQLIVFERGEVGGHLDEHSIASDRLAPLLDSCLPQQIGPSVVNEAVVTLEPYRRLLADFVNGTLPEARFQWGYLERLEREARWRDDPTFEVLNSLFENPYGRDFRTAKLIALEFQEERAGAHEPLALRAARLLERLSGGATTAGDHGRGPGVSETSRSG
jgi:bacillithiol system protein YtxJ